jgi:hypothetical protein
LDTVTLKFSAGFSCNRCYQGNRAKTTHPTVHQKNRNCAERWFIYEPQIKSWQWKTILLVFSLILMAISSTTIVSAHTAAYMIGFNAGKADGLNGIYDIGDTCNQQNGTSIITTTDSNHCNTRYDDGWNKTCHIGLTKFPDPDYTCPGFTKSELQKMHEKKYPSTSIPPAPPPPPVVNQTTGFG